MVELCLLAIGISLVIYSIAGMKKNGKSVSKKEGKNFDNIFNAEVDNFKPENLQLGIIRTELAESIFDLQKEIQVLREKIDNEIENKRDVDELLDYDYNSSNAKKDKIIIDSNNNYKNNNDNRIYVQKLVKKQLNDGKSIEDISSDLGIGRGEILLIQNLKLE